MKKKIPRKARKLRALKRHKIQLANLKYFKQYYKVSKKHQIPWKPLRIMTPKERGTLLRERNQREVGKRCLENSELHTPLLLCE